MLIYGDMVDRTEAERVREVEGNMNSNLNNNNSKEYIVKLHS